MHVFVLIETMKIELQTHFFAHSRFSIEARLSILHNQMGGKQLIFPVENYRL